MSKGRQAAKLCFVDRDKIGIPKERPGKAPRVNLHVSDRYWRKGRMHGPNESRPSQYRPKK